MAEIDLIPTDYREWQQRKTMLARFVVSLVLVNLALAGAGVGLTRTVAAHEARVAKLQAEHAVSQQQKAQLKQLDDQLAEYEWRRSLLRGLRAGAAIDEIFQLIDRSIAAESLWFLDWTFRRAGVTVESDQRGVETGYFIVVRPGDEAPVDADLSVETHMTIRGQAKDHQALSTFVRTLFEQSDVKDVNVRRTALTDYANGRVVEFDVTVVLKSAFRDS